MMMVWSGDWGLGPCPSWCVVCGAGYGEATRRLGRTSQARSHQLMMASAALSLVVGVLWLVLSFAGVLDEFFG